MRSKEQNREKIHLSQLFLHRRLRKFVCRLEIYCGSLLWEMQTWRPAAQLTVQLRGFSCENMAMAQSNLQRPA
jgi:hypothetical protein